MYNVSDDYKAAIDNDNIHALRGTVTLKDDTVILIDDDNLISQTFYVHAQCTSSTDNFAIGAVYTAEMGFTFKTDINRYSLYGAVIEAEFGLEIAVDTYEYVPLGVFRITEATRNMDTITVTALDNLSVMDVDYDWANNHTIYSEELRAPQTFAERLLFCKEMCGIEYEQEIEDIVAMTAYPPSGYKGQVATCREDIAQIAEWLGCFVIANRSGRIEFKPFSGVHEPVTEISANRRFSASFADFKTTVASVRYVDMDNNTVTQSIPDRQGITVNLNPNSWNISASDAIFTDSDGYLKGELLQKLAEIDYTPCEIEYAGNPALDVGDYVTISGGITGENSITALVCSSNWMFRGKHTIISAGSDSRLASSANRVLSPIEVQIKNTQFLAVNQTIATFVVSNTDSYSFASTTDMCSLRFTAQASALPLIYITVLYSCVADTTVNFILELNSDNYKTFTEQSTIGNHTKSIVYPLSNLPNGTHNVRLKMSGSTQVSVLAGNALMMLQGQKLSEVTGWDGSITLHDEISVMDINPYVVNLTAFNVVKGVTLPQDTDSDIMLAVSSFSLAALPQVAMSEYTAVTYFSQGVYAYLDNNGTDIYMQFDNAVTSVDYTALIADFAVSAYIGSVPTPITITGITAIQSLAQLKLTLSSDISSYDAFGIDYVQNELHLAISGELIHSINLVVPLTRGYSL